MRHSADHRGWRHGAMQLRIDWKDMLRGQIVFPLDLNRLSSKGLDGRAWVLAFVSPQSSGRELRMHLLLEFQHANAVAFTILACPAGHQSIWNRKGINIVVYGGRTSIGRLNALADCHSLGADCIGKNQSWNRLKTKFEEVASIR